MPEMSALRFIRRSTFAVALLATAAIAGISLLLLPRKDGTGVAPARDAVIATEEPLRYDFEYPAIGYSTTPPADRVAALEAKLDAGDAVLERRADRGYLDPLLRALDVDPASQVLVFSATSLQVGSIRPRTPRAIYFNDDVYVAWVQGGAPIEIASMDPNLGPVFYTLDQDEAAPELDRQMERCLRCHDSLSLTGGGVPRFIVGSGYIGTRGDIVAHEGWILTTQQTPIKNRWGGWYVTGRHGEQAHLGNIVVRNVADLEHLDRLRIGNLDTLEGLVDTTPYIAPGSDIVALLVLQHQVDVQNEIARVGYRVRTALDGAKAGDEPSAGDGQVRASPGAPIAELTEPLVEAMLFVGAAELAGPITGSSDFRRGFERRGPRDAAGRSLRDLDLSHRLLRYPLSYLVYSSAFDALPEPAKDYVYRRFADVLRGEDPSGKFEHLSAEDRTAVLEILTETKPDFAAALAERAPAALAESAPAAFAERSPAAPPGSARPDE